VLLLLSCPLLPAPGWLGCAPTGFFVPGLVWCLWLVGLGLLACLAVLWVIVGLDNWHGLGGLWRTKQRFGGGLGLKAQVFLLGALAWKNANSPSLVLPVLPMSWHVGCVLLTWSWASNCMENSVPFLLLNKMLFSVARACSKACFCNGTVACLLLWLCGAF